MSSCELAGKCKKRFKGVENFLRRVAFNLGNTPSQTEVKIISCIPIDVTDLQQKILCLEKELEIAKSAAGKELSSDEQSPVVQAALLRNQYARPPPRARAPAASRPDHPRPDHPRQLGDARDDYSQLLANTAQDDYSRPLTGTRPNDCRRPPPGTGRSLFSRLSSGTAGSRRPPGEPVPAQPARYAPASPPRDADAPGDAAACGCYSSELSSLSSHECRKSIFKKQKKKKEKQQKRKDKCNTQLVYYAQTSNSPFRNHLQKPLIAQDTFTTNDAKTEEISRAYVTEMIRKQYAPLRLTRDLSIASEFSSPVCRDEARDAGFSRPTRDSDVCSCCYGPFHDIDRHRRGPDRPQPPGHLPTCSYNINTSFYDTSLYDMIPVREKPTKMTKSHYEGSRKKTHNKNNVSPLHFTERSRSRTKVHPFIINHYGRASIPTNYSKRMPAKIVCKREKVHINPPKPQVMENRPKPTETSDSCYIDCGSVYMKRVNTTAKPPAPVLPTTTSYKNAECLTNSLNNTECQTTTSQSVQIDQELLEDKKTEETLNQIKVILQTVLTEVKTNTQQVKKAPADKTTKDAVVQKGVSQGNVPGCSTLLHSYTYSPYNMNPYLASCSRQMSAGGPPPACCYPTMPYSSAKYMHNFPVFIQSPGKQMCASCYQNTPHVPKISQMRPANTAATNTDGKERSKETEKLIKEIYKSMPVKVDLPTKETSGSECNDAKCTRRVSQNRSLYKSSGEEGVKLFVMASKARNAKPPTARSSLESKLAASTPSARSRPPSSTDTERALRNRRLETYLETVADQQRHNKIEEEREYQDESQETTASDEEESSSDSDVKVEYVPAKEPIKKAEPVLKSDKEGLFRKMFRSVKKFSTKNKKKEEEVQVDEEEESEEDSDDYQTVVSQPRQAAVRAVRSPHRLKAHSKLSYSRHAHRLQDRARRPYMEQEYRRHWNERFHERPQRYSSGGPSGTPKSVYWQNYDARSAYVTRALSPHTRPQSPYVRPPSPRTDVRSIIRKESSHVMVSVPKNNKAAKGLAWLKKHKLGIQCGPQWKKFILEN